MPIIKKKRSSFFIIDVVLSVSIILIGAFMMLSSYVKEPYTEQTVLISNDLLNFLTNNKIRDINDEKVGVYGEWWGNSIITDKDKTLLAQIGEFYYKGSIAETQQEQEYYFTLASEFIETLTKGIFLNQYRYEIVIYDNDVPTTLYPYGLNEDDKAKHEESKSKSTLIQTSNTIVYDLVDPTTGEMWGPYRAEILVWKK